MTDLVDCIDEKNVKSERLDVGNDLVPWNEVDLAGEYEGRLVTVKKTVSDSGNTGYKTYFEIQHEGRKRRVYHYDRPGDEFRATVELFGVDPDAVVTEEGLDCTPLINRTADITVESKPGKDGKGIWNTVTDIAPVA